jgi:hypothetical protein
MSTVVAAEISAVEREVTPELHNPIDGPLDIEDAPRVRTKLRLYTTLIALYVSDTISIIEYR